MGRRKHRSGSRPRKGGLTIRSVAHVMVHFLQSQGIKAMRYDAYSTNSIYLKLDYGVCGPLRISDHPGYEWLKYRFNVIKGKRGRRYSRGRYIYGMTVQDLNTMCKDIVTLKQQRMQKYGYFRYQQYMDQNQKAHENDKDKFWKLAHDLG